MGEPPVESVCLALAAVRPDRFLTALLPVVRPLISWPGFLLWLGLVGLGLVLGGLHWPDLTHDLIAQVTTPHSLMVLWLLFPLIKLLHELGHGFMTKAFGGEVHGIGRDAVGVHARALLRGLRRMGVPRQAAACVVGAAGMMMVEAALAALALVVWINAEPGLVRTAAYNTIFLAGVSTVLFNLNPLLRFDGYYMLMDWLEIPNLRARATGYVRYLCERYLFGAREVSRS